MALYPLNLCLIIMGHTRLALNINLIGLWSLSLFLLALPFFAINWRRLLNPILSKQLLIVIYIISNLIAWVNIIPALGFFTANPFAPYVGLLYGVVTGSIFLALLQYRYRQSQEQKLIEVSQARAVADFEKNKRIEQSQFMQMLSHEVKTSLSVIKMAFATEGSYKKFKSYADNAVTDINEVIERTLLADRFDSSKIEVKKSKVDLNALLDELNVLGNVELIRGNQIIVKSDVNLLRRILNNLVDNALKYGELSTPVVIRSSVSFDGETRVAIVAVKEGKVRI
jgi:signal transduction histidine kinase